MSLPQKDSLNGPVTFNKSAPWEKKKQTVLQFPVTKHMCFCYKKKKNYASDK